MRGHVVEIYCNGRLVKKLNTLDSDLKKFIAFTVSIWTIMVGVSSTTRDAFVAKPVDAVLLVNFVLLGYDNLFEAAGSIICSHILHGFFALAKF